MSHITRYLHFIAARTEFAMDEISRLRQENHGLQAKIQGLQYENQMYKQLLDNLFLKR